MESFKSNNSKNRNSVIYGDIIRTNLVDAIENDMENGAKPIDQQTKLVNCKEQSFSQSNYEENFGKL